MFCEPSDELQESLGPSGPEIPKKSEKKSPGAYGTGVPKSLEKVSKKSRTDIFETFSRLVGLFRDFFQTFSRLFGTPAPEAPGDFFQTFWGISGPEGPRDSCSSSEGSQSMFFWLTGCLSRGLTAFSKSFMC